MNLWIILLIVLGVVAAVLLVLYFLGKRAQKKQDAQMEQINQMKQNMSMLIIDKKRLPLNKSGLPQMVIDQAPKLLRRSKVPVVKAKVGPRIMILVADEKIYDDIPVKKEVKAQVSGIYIVGVKGLHGTTAPSEEKKGFIARLRTKVARKSAG